jgi:glucokinase
MSEILVADIGGSKSRFALVHAAGRPERVGRIENDTVANLEAAVADYLQQTGARPQQAIFAVAGPIGGDEIALTNRDWRFKRDELARRFDFARLGIVNDFEAIAWALPRLRADETRVLGKGALAREGLKVVLGPGTGLGVAAIFPIQEHDPEKWAPLFGRRSCSDKKVEQDGEPNKNNPALTQWHVLASEGGHASFSPQAADELEPFARMREQCGPLSAEMVLSGGGLLRLARVLDRLCPFDTPETVIANALAGDPMALATTRLFIRLLGRFAGGLALTFKAIGGVYVAGGVASGLGPLLDQPEFRAAFEAHPPHAALLRTIPTMLITADEPGLIGCAALAQMTGAPQTT